MYSTVSQLVESFREELILKLIGAGSISKFEINDSGKDYHSIVLTVTMKTSGIEEERVAIIPLPEGVNGDTLLKNSRVAYWLPEQLGLLPDRIIHPEDWHR